MNLPIAQSKSEIETAKAFRLVDMISYQEGSVVSRTLMNGNNGTITLFGFDITQGLSEHTSPYNAIANVLEGEVEITISGKPVLAKAGEIILMPAGQPHKLRAITQFKMLLTMMR